MAGIRASDADRDNCLEDIEEAYVDGCIDDAEREARTQSALQSATLAELSALVADLRPGPGPSTSTRPLSATPISPRVVRLLSIVTIVPVVVAVAVIAIVRSAGDDGAQVDFDGLPGTPVTQATPVKQQTEPKQTLALHTAAGFTRFVELTRKKFGTTQIDGGAVHPDYASINIVTAAEPRRTERWYFSRGYEGSPTKGTRRADGPIVDLGQVDVTALTRAIRRAPSVLGVEDINRTYLVFGERESQPSMSVYVSNEFNETGYWTFSLTGQELLRYAFE